MSNHVAVWIDHREARIFNVERGSKEGFTVSAPTHFHSKHPAAETSSHPRKEHPEDQKHFFESVSVALATGKSLLLVGPGSAKLEFFRFLHTHRPELESKVVGVETVDHPTDRQVVGYAKSYFEKPVGLKS